MALWATNGTAEGSSMVSSDRTSFQTFREDFVKAYKEFKVNALG